MTIRVNDFAALGSSTVANSTVFTVANPPSKTTVGLSNVNNWGASSSVSSTSTTTYATSSAVKSANDLAASKMTQATGDGRYPFKNNGTATRLTAIGTGNDYSTGGLMLNGNGSANTVFPTLGFHQPGRFASSLQLRAAADFRFYAQGSTTYASIVAANATFDAGASTTVNVICDNAGEAVLNLMGGDQGTGRLFVGQSSTYGGGIEYNGDGTPVGSGAGADYTALYRVSGGAKHWTARNSQSSNDWHFRATVHAPTFSGALSGNASTATRATQVNVNTSTSTSFYGLTWHSGNTIYASENQGLTVRPSDGFVKIKHGYLGGERLYAQADGCLVANNTGVRYAGVYGLYDSNKISHIWSMGTAYKVHTSGTNFGNLYGFAYKHTNNTTGGTMAGGHMVVWCQNGSPKVALGDNVWTSGYFSENGQRVFSPNNRNISSSVSSTSATVYASSAAAKSAYDRGTAGINAANALATIGSDTYIRSVNRWNMCGAADKGWMPSASGTNSSSSSYLGNSGWWFKEAWSNSFRGGSINVSENITAFSDLRVKTNINVIPNALDKVCQLRGVTFTRTDQEDTNTRQTGVIAQELEKVLPEAVITTRNDALDIDDFKSVNYGATVGLLIEAIKELKAEVMTLKAVIHG